MIISAMMIKIMFLVLLHLLYDFHIQGPFISEMKGKSLFLLGVHALTWALVISLGIYVIDALAMWHIIFLATTHFIVDAWKSRFTKLDPLGPALWIDQGLHFITILVVSI